jgi:hypothetical protein
VYYLSDFGTDWIDVSPEDVTCPEGFIGPKAPSTDTGNTYFYHFYGAEVTPVRLGCRISTIGFGDQCGESISAYPFYGGFT